MVTRVDWGQVASLPPGDAAVRAVAEQLDNALRRDGLLLLENVMAPEEAKEFIAEAEAFFSQPRQAKDKVGLTNKGGFIRGYLSYGAESGRPDRIFEPKEGFSFGYDWPEDMAPSNALQGPNRWPSSETYADASAFRQRMTRLFDIMTEVAARLVEVIGVALGRDPHEMRDVCRDGETISLLRAFHYHPAEASRPECLGSSPHTDWGFLTTILQDGVGGLQFKDEAGAWRDVPCTPGSLVVNGGDFLELISRGRYKSPVHRVLCPQTTRTSFVLFFYPDYKTRMDAAMFTPVSKDYNTLLELHSDAGTWDKGQSSTQQQGDGGETAQGQGGTTGASSCFGDYICKKWQQVQAY